MTVPCQSRVARYAGVVGPNKPEEIVILCCVIKPLVSWHCERVGSITRERCGGQGYLSANRFGQIIAFSHAGITAEVCVCPNYMIVLVCKVSSCTAIVVSSLARTLDAVG